MIQKGIIESIVSLYEYKVRIPRYDKLVTTPGGVHTEDLASAIVCSVPGTKMAYCENDIVLVSFENDELNKPVILGLLYRENNGESDQFVTPGIQASIDKIENILDELTSNKLYTHIKYSNDNGLTFTSLYEYSNLEDYVSDRVLYKGIDNIIIDPNSSVIYWSVIDADNINVTSSLNIITTLSSQSANLTQSFSGSLIPIPLQFIGLSDLRLSFRIVETSDYDDLHFVLTTDKNTLGSVYGDYIGVNVSTSLIPSLNPADYSWTSFYEVTYKLIEKLENSLLPRVERNEKTLYGYTYSTSNQETDGTGLLDGVRVEKNIINIHGADNKDISFNTSNSMFIDNNNDNLTLKTLESTNVGADKIFSESYSNKGHLTLILKKKAK